MSKEKSPLSAWLHQYLGASPEATFAATRAAAKDAGFDLKRPIAYGLARRSLGLAPMTKRPARAPKERRTRRSAPAAAAAPAPSTRRRAADGALDGAGIAGMLKSFEDLVGERDRLLAAITQIERILRAAL